MYSPGATVVGPAGAVVPPARALALAAAQALALAAAGAVVAPAGAVQSRATAKQDADWLVGRSVGWLVGWFGAQIMHAPGKYGSNIRPIMYSPGAKMGS